MPAKVLDGRAAAAAIRAELTGEVERLTAAGRRPILAAVLVGDDAASHISSAPSSGRPSASASGRAGGLPADAAQKDVLAGVAELDADEAVDGILVQLPLPAGLDPVEVQDAIDPAKASTGGPENEGRLLRGDPG